MISSELDSAGNFPCDYCTRLSVHLCLGNVLALTGDRVNCVQDPQGVPSPVRRVTNFWGEHTSACHVHID